MPESLPCVLEDSIPQTANAGETQEHADTEKIQEAANVDKAQEAARADPHSSTANATQSVSEQSEPSP